MPTSLELILQERVKKGKLTQADADALIAKRTARLAKKDATLTGLKISTMTNAQQGKLLELIAIRLGLADDITGKVL